MAKEEPERNADSYTSLRLRPDIMAGATQRIKTGCGNVYITINESEDGRPFELFTQMGKAGGCSASQCEAVGRLVSLVLRLNGDPDIIVKQLTGISCHQPTWENGKKTLSCSDAIAKALKRYLDSSRSSQARDDISVVPMKPLVSNAATEKVSV